MSDLSTFHIRTTRYRGLGYTNLGATDWRFVDLTDPDPMNIDTVGPRYRSREELLADLHRYASVFGADTYRVGTRFVKLAQLA